MIKRPHAGFTLIEILVATTLALLLLAAVVTIFGNVAQSITESRSMLEMAEQLRLTATRLQQDLAGVTVTMNPPRKPENNEGYFEYIEGPVGTSSGMAAPSSVAVNTDNANSADTTVGDFDDILMFTTRSTGRPFVGKCGVGNTIQSDVAEVAWFLRGRTLHRRVLLVAPAAFGISVLGTGSYYTAYDVSARWDNTQSKMVANTLGDLTRRECRFAHLPTPPGTFPFDVSTLWSWKVGAAATQYPMLPTLNECSSSGWLPAAPQTPTISNLDFWTNNPNYRVTDNALIGGGTNSGNRLADDVILNNVIGFDVKVWDPDYVDPTTGAKGGYVDLGYPVTAGTIDRFSNYGVQPVDRITPKYLSQYTYDTWSTHYESANVPSLGGTAGQGTNGLDDGGTAGIVDDAGELRTSPPYPYPLRGIQVKIRAFEPDSKQIREVTVIQDFLPQ